MNAVPHLQQLLMLALSMVLPKKELEQGEKEGRIGEVTRAAIRRFLVENSFTIPDGLQEQSPEWSQWIIQHLEAAKKPDFIVYGQVQGQKGQPLPGVTVKAFDRDLPSLGRRTGSPQQLLGEAVTNQAGEFAITYSFGQFNEGESEQRVFDRTSGKRADLSFQVLDPNGQELSIIKVMAQDREFGPTEIIFNVPERLEVTIFAEPRSMEGLSEYERILARINPIIQDVPLAELTDEDVEFILREIGLDQGLSEFGHTFTTTLGDGKPYIEWPRRSAILARQTGLPIEAFYGWGARTSRPHLRSS